MKISCPYCKTEQRQVKAGMHGGFQRYKCMTCLRKYVPKGGQRSYSDDIKQNAFRMHEKGYTLAEIAASVNVNRRTVSHWIEESLAISEETASSEANHSSDSMPDQADSSLSHRTRSRPTIEHVAQLAHVSTSTVSNFMNHTGRMSADTRARIREAIDELNFTPNALMRGMRQGRTGILGVYVYGLSHLDAYLEGAVTPPLISGMNSAAEKTQQNLLLFTGWEMSEGIKRWSQFLDGHIDGLIWVDPLPDEPALIRLASAGLPVVSVLSRHVPDGVGYVNSDNIGGVESAVRHLYELGHRRIAYAGGIDKSNYLDRLEGYRRGITAVGLPFDPSIVATGSKEFYWYDGYYAGLDAWFQLDNKPTAIIYPDDRTANEMIGGLWWRGLRVPYEISVVGFDDMPDPQHKVPGGLTTIRQDFRRLGELAFEQLSRLVAGVAFEECRVTVPTQLIVRGSTGPLLTY